MSDVASSGPTESPPATMLDGDESLVELRCSLVLSDGDRVVLIHRTGVDRDDWVLPGGRPRPGESLTACASREAREEIGVEVNPTRIAFVGEVIDPGRERRIIEVVFLGGAPAEILRQPLVGEPGAEPCWVTRAELAGIAIRPPIAGYLPSVMHANRSSAAYLGNLWRPTGMPARPAARPDLTRPGAS